MALWLVRAGKYGADEGMALDQSLAVVGFSEVADVSSVTDREALKKMYEENTSFSKHQIANFIGQLWAFVHRIAVDDLVVLPLKTRTGIAIGHVKGPYRYFNGRHVRDVQWVRTDIPRADFGQDLLYSFGAFMTVCKIERNNAEERVQAMLSGGRDPFLQGKTPAESSEDTISDTETTVQYDLEENAQDQIRQFIETRFKGHDLTRLVSAILKLQGYFTHQAPPGPDGGVDIIAGRGAMGFDAPRLCVQVKSGSPVDDQALRELEGVMGRMNAEHGLFVSWGGFKSSVVRKTSDLFFKVRLWDASRLIAALLETYENLPDDIQAEIPLKRIWVPVLEEE